MPAGVDTTHPDLIPNLLKDSKGVIQAYNALTKKEGAAAVKDGHGHGTHCAGTLGAAAFNKLGVAGVALNVSVSQCGRHRGGRHGAGSCSSLPGVHCLRERVPRKAWI